MKTPIIYSGHMLRTATIFFITKRGISSTLFLKSMAKGGRQLFGDYIEHKYIYIYIYKNSSQDNPKRFENYFCWQPNYLRNLVYCFKCSLYTIRFNVKRFMERTCACVYCGRCRQEIVLEVPFFSRS